jgi:hypothetical protein
MKLFVETHVRSDDCEKEMQQLVNSQAQHFVIFWFSIIFFLSYFFLEFDEFIFSFQKTYSNQLKERYEDDLLTHSDINPDLWLEVGSFDGPNGNQVYRLSNTTTENLRTTLSALTVRCSQSIMSIQTPKFTAIFRPMDTGSDNPS